MEKEKNKNTRSRKYLLTINNPQNHNITHETIIKALQTYSVKYLALCDEIGSQHTYHTHIYVCYFHAINFLSIKKLLPTANIQTAQGSSKDNRAYLLKSKPEHNRAKSGEYSYTDAAGRNHSGLNLMETFEEIGECPEEKQGKRNDLEQLYSLVKEGYSDAEILEAIPQTAIQHIDRIGKLRLAYLTDKYKSQRRLNLKVNYITGKTGTGKSRDILDEFGDENVYRVTDYHHPFDSYQCEPVLVFEEYRSSIKLQDMLNYADIYPVTLPARYSPKVGCYSTVFVVSNWTFEQQYAELQKDEEQKSSYEAWVRRFNGYVKEYYDIGKYRLYPTMQDYLKRHEAFHPVTESTPFDEPHIPECDDNEPSPFS